MESIGNEESVGNMKSIGNAALPQNRLEARADLCRSTNNLIYLKFM